MKSYKNIFPFLIGTTSYILHDKNNSLVTNVSYLKNYFSIIQLLFYAKEYLEEVMSYDILQQLDEIKQKNSVSYIIHLPLDFNLLHPSRKAAEENIKVIERIIRETEFLDIYKYILHIDGCINFRYLTTINSRGMHFRFNNVLEGLAKQIGNNTFKIAIENTDYDLTFYNDIIKEYNYSVCMDVGHILRYDNDLEEFIKAFDDRISVVHLHGCKDNRDHRSLKAMESAMLIKIAEYLQHYNQALIVEVFNKGDLKHSLKRLTQIMGDHGRL